MSPQAVRGRRSAMQRGCIRSPQAVWHARRPTHEQTNGTDVEHPCIRHELRLTARAMQCSAAGKATPTNAIIAQSAVGGEGGGVMAMMMLGDANRLLEACRSGPSLSTKADKCFLVVRAGTQRRGTQHNADTVQETKRGRSDGGNNRMQTQ